MQSDNIFLWIKATIVAAAGAFSAAFGWLGWLILAWVGCMVLDWISGSAAAAAKGKWSSAVARAGIWHKGGMIVVVLVAAVADCVLGMAAAHFPVLGIDYTVLVLPVILVWYIFTELGSIAENATDMGAPVPAWLTRLLAAGKQLAEQQLDLPDGTDDTTEE
ncbi:phage holin family protein [Subdoligranulum variabile]|uniref:Toxin secretion/phage lysis holin n=1 Tax=Subdoligranulum variabile DSM 15176 TaxID=411471 RepID=D1PLA8_9FIRM|nr:phage holin family protein [Subdoligranulum variabile]EFB76766.1 toxin secretion/phage lysis holin [Subdoligranulum variabile DSM 15176]UWP68012.1 phage holin family protein [Subdoligranulum variabile]